MEIDDKTQLIMLYENMYQLMISKNTGNLAKILSEEFSLHHITRMVQKKQEFLQAVRQGILNYFSAAHEKIQIFYDGKVA